MESKIKRIENEIFNLKKICNSSLKKKKYEKALAAISSCAMILYEYNQRYTDDYLEKVLTEEVKKAVDRMLEQGYASPTVFEIETAIAFLFFVKENCDFKVFIPMVGHVNSLNASVSASILFYEILRNRG